MCIVHGYTPNSCLNTTIVPICKNKNGNMSNTSNYRPVAVATVVSKLLEHFILSNISPFLGTTDNQFGFKAGYSTDQCTFLLKQTASYFVTVTNLRAALARLPHSPSCGVFLYLLRTINQTFPNPSPQGLWHRRVSYIYYQKIRFLGVFWEVCRGV